MTHERETKRKENRNLQVTVCGGVTSAHLYTDWAAQFVVMQVPVEPSQPTSGMSKSLVPIA